jgi:hypothetical protein
VFDRALAIACFFQQMGANGVETIVPRNARIAVENPKQFETLGRAVHLAAAIA